MLRFRSRCLLTLTMGALALLPRTALAQSIIQPSEEPTLTLDIVTTTVPAYEALLVSPGSSEPLLGRQGIRATIPGGELLARAEREVRGFRHPTASGDVVVRGRQQPAPQKSNWLRRHPVLFGTLAGFGAGYLIGHLPGDDGVFDDFVASFNGVIIGGIGAGTGAAIGAVVGASTK